jgi:O-antigen ligase
MLNKNINNKIYLFANMVIILYGFVLFIDHKISRAIAIILLILWLITGDYKNKINKIFKNKLVVSVLLYIGVFTLGLLWSENFYAGRKILERPLLLLVVPIIYTMYQKRFLKYYLLSFLSSITFTAILIILCKYNIIDLHYSASSAPFMNRNYIATILAFSSLFFLYKLIFKNSMHYSAIITFFISVINIYALLITQSRTGLILFLIGIVILLVKKIGFSLYKVVVVMMLSSLLFIGIYKLNKPIQNRVNHTISVIEKLDLKKQIEDKRHPGRGALTCRFEFWYYAYNIGKKHPILGVGTGDGILELEKLIGKNETKKLFKKCLGNGSGQFNPHNMYLFMWMQFGILGLIVIFYMVYIQLKESLKINYLPMILFLVTVWVSLLEQSALFTTRYFIPYYGYGLIILYLIGKEIEKNEIQSNK